MNSGFVSKPGHPISYLLSYKIKVSSHMVKSRTYRGRGLKQLAAITHSFLYNREFLKSETFWWGKVEKFISN